MEEEWKPIKDFEDYYEVSNLGNVRSERKVLKQLKRRHGYLSVFLYDRKGGYKQASVHRLVAEAFIPNPNGYEEVNHKDECKANNKAANLEWCSHKQNNSYGTRGKRIGAANTNGKRSKPIIALDELGNVVMRFPSLNEATRQGYNQSNVCLAIRKGVKRYGYFWKFS